MNRRMISLLTATLSLLFFCMCTNAETVSERSTKDISTKDISVEQILDQKLNNNVAGILGGKASSKIEDFIEESDDDDDDVKKIDINFDSIDLGIIINKIAKVRGVNVVLPTGADEIKSKVTLQMDERLTISKAWKLLYTIIDIAGYSLFKRLDGYAVVKNDKKESRRALPVYIGVAPDDLPDTDKRIRYLFYFSNIQVPSAINEKTELNEVLVRLLPTDVVRQYMPTSNGVLLVGKSNDLKSVMKVVLELDKVGFREDLDVIPLRYASADIVAGLFTNQLLKAAQPMNRYRRGVRRKTQAKYFTKNMKIIPVGRTNSLIVLGRKQAIDRIREFIYKYIDVKLDSGKSILHVYQLQYLDAAKFKKTLEGIVKMSSSGGTGQSRASGKAKGPERFFEGVIIQTDMPAGDGNGKASFGGNQLIIAARNDDWIRIKRLIEELDKPQPQVIIEVLVADLTVEDERALGAHTRTPASINTPELFGSGGMQFQAAANAPAVAGTVDNKGANLAEGLNVDLLKNGGYGIAPDGTTTVPVLPSAANGGSLDNGSTVVSLSDGDGKTWSILQILEKYENTKILSHPHVVATNNQKATVIIGETRMVHAEAAVAQGTAVAKREEKDANLKVEITPRISAGNTVNLQVDITLNEFKGDSADRIDRTLKTNANVKSGSVLALGGLIKVNTNTSLSETPILGKIPILGWLFKRRGGKVQKNNLTVFIRPTIVQPRLRGGIDTYTRDYIKVAQEYVNEGMLFDTLREPVTRWFFKTGIDAKEAIKVFASESPQRRPVYDTSNSVVKNENVPMPRLARDPNTTVMAAIDGPSYRGKSSQSESPRATSPRVVPPRALQMKRDLMDFSPSFDNKKEEVMAKQESSVDLAEEEPLDNLQKNNKVVAIIEPKESKDSKSKTPEEQLKLMFADESNPLLRS